MGGGSPVGSALLGLVVVVCAVAGTILVVLARRRSRAAPPVPPAPTGSRTLRDVAGVDDLTDGGLALVLFSRAACPRCRDTREVLDAVVAGHAGVVHREVDVADRATLATALAVRTTPTVVVVDASGTEVLRVAGVPRREDLVAALAPHLP